VAVRKGETRFACDAMMGALARWLRAAGYDCFWQEGIDDTELVELAKREGMILLSADSGIFQRNAVIMGEVKAMYVLRDLPREKQVAYVLRTFDLHRRGPRCMACGGKLEIIDAEDAKRSVPKRALTNYHEFYRCSRCKKVYWQGTHWSSVDRRLTKLGLEIEKE
jgi:uncharacterized protein with PIN domain